MLQEHFNAIQELRMQAHFGVNSRTSGNPSNNPAPSKSEMKAVTILFGCCRVNRDVCSVVGDNNVVYGIMKYWKYTWLNCNFLHALYQVS